MVYVLDIGNTRVKGAVFEGNMLKEQHVFDVNDIDNSISIFLKKYPKISNILVASVLKASKEDFKTFSKQIKIHFVSSKDVFPFENKYATPNSLGVDRMVLASGATLLYPKTNRLVIDAGTCVTFDFIDEKNNYHGGAISPGLRLRYEALHNFTAKLPLLTLENPIKFIGNSTHQSIHAGVVNGLVYEIDGFIDEFKSTYEKFTIILTGGDAEFLAKRLKNTIFANSNFLLESLNQLFQYKSKND